MPETPAEDLLRELAPQVLGALVRRYGHFDTAEDAVQEALIAAAHGWPRDGVPENPRGWLITVASRRLTDLLRREQARMRREDTVARWVLPEQWRAPAADRPPADADDTLILLFLCCHPALSAASQIALTLRAVGGLSTAEWPRVPGAGGDDDPADQPGQAAHPRQWRCGSRRPPARSAPTGSPPCCTCST